jgi:hypothetical protein
VEYVGWKIVEGVHYDVGFAEVVLPGHVARVAHAEESSGPRCMMPFGESSIAIASSADSASRSNALRYSEGDGFARLLSPRRTR